MSVCVCVCAIAIGFDTEPGITKIEKKLLEPLIFMFGEFFGVEISGGEISTI